MTNDGLDMFKYCQFPFKHKGRQYSTCALEQSSGRYWCATEVNPMTGEMVQGRRGYCDPNCPKEHETQNGFRQYKCEDSTKLCKYLKPHCEKKDVKKGCLVTCGSCIGGGINIFNQYSIPSFFNDLIQRE